MRGGACAVQQTLTAEAASVLKHSLNLARRRGHAQVTPLHVAATLLSSRASLLKRACLKSQPHQTPHPLQSRALELCFNVALNRLPTTPAPLLHAQPSLSNALIAALKRAQAHQRRGCIEQQQQQPPLLAIKVELDQLTLSILDDPSVSRVMREAGFSSTAVKNNLEEDSPSSSIFHCYGGTGGGVYSSPCSPSRSFWPAHFVSIADSASLKEDIKLVLEVLLRKKRRNTVIVGDSLSITEGLVLELMSRVERGEVPDELKSAHFVKFHFTSVPLMFMKREELELQLSELKRKVDSLASGGRGVIIYTGDLKWIVDTVGFNGEFFSGYSPVEHLVTEMARFLSHYNSLNRKVWLMATANYQTYMRCQMKQPSLEMQWSLQAVSVPSGGLGLSLHATSVQESRMSFSENPSQALETKAFVGNKDEDNKLRCCAECTSKYEKEAALLKSGSAQLPSWLQSHNSTHAHQKDDLVELRRQWNKICHSQHQGRPLFNQRLIPKSCNYRSSISYPRWPNENNFFLDSNINNSISFSPSNLKSDQIASSPLQPRFRRQQSCHIEFSFSNGFNHKQQLQQPMEPNLDSLKNSDGKEVKITLALGNFSQHPNSTKRSDQICKRLQENVPWQLGTIPSIVEALIEPEPMKKETKWLLIEGNDAIGKRRLARAIAESVFGSPDLLLHMNMRESREDHKRVTVLERALRNNEKTVVLVEDVDFADTQFLKVLSLGMETGSFGEFCRKDGETIFILTRGDCPSHGDGIKDLNSVIHMKLEVNRTLPSISEVGIQQESRALGSPKKRKAEWDVSNKAKSPRQPPSGSTTLDLNIKADEDEEDEDRSEGFSPNSSDLTREMGNEGQINPCGFLESIKNRLVFNSDCEKEIKEMILVKIRDCFEAVIESSCFLEVEESLLEKLLLGFGDLVNSLFEKWLKEVFRTSLLTVKNGRKEGISSVRLCLGGKEDRELEGLGLDLESGFMASALPKKIQVSFMG
ncbi:protein SMAX1-LIKE 4-like [Diospyros lotus]|uniref:protein SMAX1-LIKE 4-like n=1 Tax=Diospyros lotus TaxID=55363 RepID=UPI002256F85D|nr:protein SMAX1-LIKE 4-like [Diospyros lotus]